MNFGLITSYIIAGIILMAILMMNIRVTNSSAEITMMHLTKERASVLIELLYDDVPNMGYDLYDTSPEIITIADSTKIQFYRKIDRLSSGGPELITWEFTDTPVTETKNPDDRVLLRTVEKDGVETVTEMKQGITRFNLWYFDEQGLSTLPEDGEFLSMPVSSTLRDSIKQIYIAFELQSEEPIRYSSNNIRYIRSAWEKRFSPTNLDN